MGEITSAKRQAQFAPDHEVREQILEILRSSPVQGATTAELAAETGLSRDSVQKRIELMAARGLVHRRRQGSTPRAGWRYWHPDHAEHAAAWRPPVPLAPRQIQATRPEQQPRSTLAPARPTGRLTEPRTEIRVIDGRPVKVTLCPQPAPSAAPPESIFGNRYGRYSGDSYGTAVARAYSTGRDA